LTLNSAPPRISKSTSKIIIESGVDAVLIATDTTDEDVQQLREALRKALGTTKEDFAPAHAADWRDGWQAVADLGVTAFCVPEDKGGFGLRADVAAAAAMEFGAALHSAPYAGLTASAHALAHAADSAAEDLLSGVLAGDRICSFGYLGREGTVARLIDGAPQSDAVVLVDRSGGLLLLADPGDWIAVASHGERFDVSRQCGAIAVNPGAGRPLPTAVVADELFRLLLAADAVGGVQRMLDRTVAFAGERQAFGRPIGGFQAVQHRLVDHSVRTRGMALLVGEAARRLGAGAAEGRRFVAMAEVSVSSAATHILHDLLQLTGAIGFTWEYGLHYYERRVHHDARLAANPRAAVQSLAHIEEWDRAS
jgi:alkylation response protein AidB-like acyl-CoA dehydrogenase